MIRGEVAWLRAEALWRLEGELAEGLPGIYWGRANKSENDM
jgi:hypothetical protein